MVALRKESVDRNKLNFVNKEKHPGVALRKESVDRNSASIRRQPVMKPSLSARRAWIEIPAPHILTAADAGRSPQGERG